MDEYKDVVIIFQGYYQYLWWEFGRKFKLVVFQFDGWLRRKSILFFFCFDVEVVNDVGVLYLRFKVDFFDDVFEMFILVQFMNLNKVVFNKSDVVVEG